MEDKGVRIHGKLYRIIDYVFQTGNDGDAVLQLELKEIKEQ